jgi:tricorn protease
MMMTTPKSPHYWRRCTLALAALCLSASASAREGYYRWPALHGENLVFASEGDLWRVARSGGAAMRLTTHPAEESQPVISPDGKTLAFIASYDSAPEVYLMPLAGGLPERVSFDASRVAIQGFSPQGDLLYTSDATVGPGWTRELRRYSVGKRSTESIALTHVSDAALASDNTLWFTRFGLQLTGDNAQAYRGGAMAQLWRMDLASSAEATRLLPKFQGNMRELMLSERAVFMISDADGMDNLWQLAPGADVPQPLTKHRDFGVRAASLSGEYIAYQLGADLHLLHWPSGQDTRLSITLSGDQDAQRKRLHSKSLSFLTSSAIAPDGKYALLNIRGELLRVAAGQTRLAQLPRAADSRYRSAVFSKDGRRIFAISDRAKGSAIVSLAADGSGDETLLLATERYVWQLQLSPDGRSLAFDDKRAQLSILDIANRSERVIDSSTFGADQPYESFRFSPDGRFLLAVRPNSALGREQLMLIDLSANAKAAPLALSSDRYVSYSADFSPDGRWLYFLSDRSWQGFPGSPWGDRNTGVLFDRRGKIYALALQDDAKPFAFTAPDELSAQQPNAQEPNAQENSSDSAARNESGANRKPTLPAIDTEGLAQRLYELPIGANNFLRLSVSDKHLFVLTYPAQLDGAQQLHSIAIDHRNPSLKSLADNVADYQLSSDRKRLLIQKSGRPDAPGDVLLVDAKDSLPEPLEPHTVAIAAWRLAIDPAREWQQMFDDAWRMQKQFLFDANMRGVDWDAVRKRVQPLLVRVGDRTELDDLFAQMIAPLGMLHSQVRFGDLRLDSENSVDSFLGAQFVQDDAEPGLGIATIWQGDSEQPSERGPLLAPNVRVRAGDRLLAVNGRSTNTLAELSAALQNQVRQQTLLTLKRAERTQRVMVMPVDAEREATLRYTHWVSQQRRAVEQASKGKIAYLHLRAMGPGDLAQFVRDFYAAIDRNALIIDVRSNRGGNIDSFIVEKLLRRSWAFWQPVNRQPYWNMQQSFRGHLVLLADQFTYSDGETLTAAVKALKLGTVIGRRTAGAGVWLSGRNALVDGGTVRAAEFGAFTPAGQLMIEGQGVEPDIVVENPPHASATGADAQRERAVQFLLDKLQREPIAPAQAQAIPPLR